MDPDQELLALRRNRICLTLIQYLFRKLFPTFLQAAALCIQDSVNAKSDS